ncbi:MAG TPA: thioesterase family protein [Streptosporangiaceae bacterium]|nr:thioesterase family protein [Streptosporangiaceae bacterium]
MTVFDQATAVSLRSEGRYDAAADPRFALVAPGGATPPAVNGGALMATVLRAVLECSPHPHPVATSANFLRVPQLAPAEVHVSWLKQGKTASIARAALVQDGQPVLDATVTTGTLPARPMAASTGTASIGAANTTAGDGTRPASSQLLDWTGERPRIADIAECLDLGSWPGTLGADGSGGFAAHVEVLLDPACTGWRQHEPSGVPEMRGYVRLREHRDPDALLLALAVDALPPVVFGLGATGWAPTVTLTWHMRGVPASGPLQVSARCRHVSGGWFDEEAEVWDAAGRLVAQSRQLARVGRGRLRAMASESAAPAVSEGSAVRA